MADEKPQWIETLLSLYSEGMSDAEVIKELKITRQQFDDYCRDVPAFAELVARGRDYSEAWWLTQGRVNLKNKDFVTALWVFNVKNRLGWGDKKELPDNSNFNYDKINEELRRVAPELMAKYHPGAVISLGDARNAVVKSSGKG
jgi:hypothetical protein